MLGMDHMLLAPEMLPVEPEGALDESGEHFFDAREAHSDDNPSEGDGTVKKEEDVNLRISGKFSPHWNYDLDLCEGHVGSKRCKGMRGRGERGKREREGEERRGKREKRRGERERRKGERDREI